MDGFTWFVVVGSWVALWGLTLLYYVWTGREQEEEES